MESKFGTGKGTVVDLRETGGAVERVLEWTQRAEASHRLLVLADSHRGIKKAERLLKGTAKAYGLTLKYRFGHEPKRVKREVLPGLVIEELVKEYEMWVLCHAKARVHVSDGVKRYWMLRSVCGMLDRDERELPKTSTYPKWIFEMSEAEDGSIVDRLDVTQEQRNEWLEELEGSPA